MAVNMDEADKNFLLGWFEKLEKKIEGVQTHQKKTCDELDEVDKKVVKISSDMKNHLDNVQEKQRTSREKKAIIISVASVCSAVIIGTISIFVAIS